MLIAFIGFLSGHPSWSSLPQRVPMACGLRLIELCVRLFWKEVKQVEEFAKFLQFVMYYRLTKVRQPDMNPKRGVVTAKTESMAIGTTTGSSKMPRIPIIPRNFDASGKDLGMCRGSHALTRPLPIFYMSDYSVLGLLVDKYEETLRVLDAGRVAVIQEGGDLEVAIDQAGDLEQIVQLLGKNGIHCEFADVVSGIYQG